MTQILLQRHNNQLCITTLLRQAGIPADACSGLKDYGTIQVPACQTQTTVNHVVFHFDYNDQNDNRQHDFSFIEITATKRSYGKEIRRTLLKQRTISGVTLSYANLEGLKQRYDELLPIALQGAKEIAEQKARLEALEAEQTRKQRVGDDIMKRIHLEHVYGKLMVRAAQYGDLPEHVAWQVTLKVDSPEILEAILKVHKGLPLDQNVTVTDDRLQATPGVEVVPPRGRVRMPKPWKGDV